MPSIVGLHGIKTAIKDKMLGVFRLLKKSKEYYVLLLFLQLIPLVSFLSLAVGGATTMCFYSLAYKSDVIINKTRNPTPWENIDPRQPQKLWTIKQEWKPVEEVQTLKKMVK
ncbi:normal mucosa of esophagus-specific gene 1 protein [Latimeria chalumnae]|uniref:normal mucosa of esophagus-specific gene 1 protein n=1 Tax=Latimeria chalumnae TaxID=7897 RepID=UPI0006D8E331|nr:PREDICTED: normal mucosa of esophagus-specific gene 1 protein-like [Latimeria chalumnae]|eukprot:XP_005999547.2 PREDICTED: normal mucosa of esophagus-specific gene 1 protein-like [Latimeria chalumnae]